MAESDRTEDRRAVEEGLEGLVDRLGILMPHPNPSDHPYESYGNGVCVRCGQIGSYIHTPPEQR